MRAAVLAACLGLGMIQAYQAVARYEAIPRDTGDSSQYIALSEGRPLPEIIRIYRWRVLTPLLVRWMPAPPAALTAQYQVDADKVLRFKYAVWNSLGNIACAFALMLLLPALGLSAVQGAAAALLYMTSTQVMLDGAAVLVDAWANAAIAASLLFALRGDLLWLALSFSAGLFVKETLAVVPAYLVLSGGKDLLKRLAVLAPGLAAYAWFRCVLYPGGEGVDFTAQRFAAMLADYAHPGRWAYVASEFLLNFALLAPLAWLGWKASAACPTVRRWAWLLPALFVAPFAIGSELTRPWFNGFPVFIPLAVLGIWELLEIKSKAKTARR